VNASRGAEHSQGAKTQNTSSLQTPVSNPGSDSDLGQQEEGREATRSDPSEPDEVKRSRVEQEGQKPLDAADK